MKQKALVILSGGQDSTTCVWWAIERFGQESVESLTFDYRQLHRHELHAARQVAAHAGIPNVVLPINTFEALGGSALTDPSIEVHVILGGSLKGETFEELVDPIADNGIRFAACNLRPGA